MNENKLDLESIRKRAEAAQGNPLRDIDVIFKSNRVITQDVPALIAEVERLREALEYLSEDYSFDSTALMAEVAKSYLNGTEDE